MPRRLAALPLLLAASLLSACASAPPEIRHIAARNSSAPLWWHRIAGDYRYRIFCAEVERAGFFERQVPQGLDPNQRAAYAAVPQQPYPSLGAMFAPDRAGSVNPNNPYYLPASGGAVNCFCRSAARREVLTVCPYNPGQGD